MLLLCALVAGSLYGWATDYSYTFTSTVWSAAGAQTLNGVSWTMAGTGGSYFGYDGTKGQQFGSGSKPYSALSLTTSGISGTITSVAVNTSGASSISGTVAVSVDGNDFECDSKTTASLTSSAASYTFTGSASGNIVISWAQTSSKAIYVKSITVTYSTGSGSDPSISLGETTVNATEAAVSTTSIDVTYNNLTNYDADVIFYESDGTTYATYDHSWLTAEINASTKNLDYTITANTGAARTAYLRVYAVGDEGDAESSLITITQAKKSVASPEFNPDGGSYMQGTNITISSAGNTIYYNIKTDGSTPGDPTDASTEYTGPIALGSGTTKIKAIAYDTYGNASSVVTRTYTGIALASLPFSWTGTSSAGKDDLAEQTGVALSLGSDYAASNAPYRLKFDGTSKYVIIYTDEKPENVYFTAKLFNAASTGSKIKVQGSADGITFTDIEEFTIKGAANATFEFSTSNAFATTHRAVKLVMSSKDQNVAVGTICVSCIPISPAKTYTTLTSAYALDFTGLAGLKAYIATEVSEGNVLMTQVNKVPANTGLVLKATTPGSAVNVPVFDGTSPDDVSGNKMAGSATATTAVAENAGYILSDGFFQPASAGTLPAGKAYLNIAVSSARSLNMIFDDEMTTGIENIEHGSLNIEHSVYDLQGRRVSKPTKGLYIVNGRKVVIK